MKTVKTAVVYLAAAVGALMLLVAPAGRAQPGSAASPVSSDAIRPFQVHLPKAALTDLRKRLRATRWPEQETVPDRSQGMQLMQLQSLVQYWATEYDWRKAEARLN